MKLTAGRVEGTTLCIITLRAVGASAVEDTAECTAVRECALAPVAVFARIVAIISAAKMGAERHAVIVTHVTILQRELV